MKSRLLKYTVLAVAGFVLCLLFSRNASAQCYFVYSSNYAVYTSESTDGTNIFTSVLTDGSASMSIGGGNCGPGYQIMQNQINSASHTPEAYNVVGGTGGWGSGSSGCVNCYLSYQNNQSIIANGAQTYDWQWQGEVRCSVGGSIFSTGLFSHRLSIGKVNFILEHYDSANCYYMQWCPNGNVGLSPCVADFHSFTAYGGNNPRTRCTAFHYAWEFFLVVDGTCEPVGISVLATEPINCQ